MKTAKVVGRVWATIKDDRLSEYRLLRVQLLDQKTEEIRIAADSLGAGIGDIVLLAGGSSARMDHPDQNIPVDASIIAIVDEKHKIPQEEQICSMN